jgi:hypothetical protein
MMNIIPVFKITIVLLITALSSGCVQINLPQLTSLQQLMYPPVDPLDQHKWQLQVGEYKTTVYLMTISGQRVFVSEAKDVLVLEPANGLVQISIPSMSDAIILVNDVVDDNLAHTSDKPATTTRQIIVNDVLLETQTCGYWQLSQSEPQTQERTCQGEARHRDKRVVNNDLLVQLSQFVPHINQSIVLTKLIK